jgi:CheY-like chemotaxis protein
MRRFGFEREYSAAIDLMLTDVVMPGMHGHELADRLGRLRPSLRVLFMSGYTTHTGLQDNDARRGRGFIRKPFDPFVLAGSIRDLLG